jgi:cell division protein FtsB
MADRTRPDERAPRGPRRPASVGADRSRWRWYAAGFACAALLVNAVVGERGYLELRRMQQRHTDAVQQLERQRAENQALRGYVRQLKTDPAAMEREIRAQLGYVRPGELVFSVRDAAPGASPRPPAQHGKTTR